ncbi:MAG TPA: 16S rRNA (cytosine(1402)-N(4))-methyltransferase [Lachnospiraceae bacterium]|jgi:16S rRNA (cytosine1402-N4)-methyltransferase|nr:16S rRNA (cytosine(1402)-N(4))-methyltransferase [Lachnospiraceae bacterium]
MKFKHIPIMLEAVLSGLNIKEDGIYVDGTLGGAGHSYEIARRLSDKGRLIGIDQDKDAIEAATERLKEFQNINIVRNNYVNIRTVLGGLGIDKVDGILLDIGVSSYQLDNSERGFSYREDAPLDMRMDQSVDYTAQDIVNDYSEEELRRIISVYGEEKFAPRIAANIVKAREISRIETTYQLNDIIKESIPAAARRTGGNPSKKTYQAIRIELNKELTVLEDALEDMIDLLNPGGRLAIITFHSLEDRIVKNAFRTAENPCICPPEFPVCTCGRKSKGKVITRKPIVADEKELEINPRSSSAKLRVFERV